MHVHFRAPSSRLLATWILLLAGAQLADVITTGVALARGGVEANRLVAALISHGGLGLVVGLKLLLVAALAITCWVLKGYADGHPSLQARAAHAFVWRAIQLSVAGLLMVAVHNTALLAQIA